MLNSIPAVAHPAPRVHVQAGLESHISGWGAAVGCPCRSTGRRWRRSRSRRSSRRVPSGSSICSLGWRRSAAKNSRTPTRVYRTWVERLPCAPLARRRARSGVEAEAGGEAEPPVVRAARCLPSGARRSRSPSSSAPVASMGSLGMPSARTKTFVEPAGTMPRAGMPGVHAVGQQAVDDLVDRAVAAERHDDVGAVAHRATGQRRGVAAVLGLLDLEVRVAAERMGENVALTRAHRGRARIHHDEHSHVRQPTCFAGLPAAAARQTFVPARR